MFFVTPELLKLFDEDNDFTSKALGFIHQEWPASLQDPQNPRNYQHFLEIRVAVVDRIPLPEGQSSGLPGISFLAARRRTRQPSQNRRLEFAAAARREGEVPQIRVKIPIPRIDGKWDYLRTLLRPANTLFLNGRQSTMFTETWTFDDNAASGARFSRQSARVFIHDLTLYCKALSSSLTMPLQRLTRPKEIAMCMGNILSKLVGERHLGPTSASLELEEKVAAFMRSRVATNGTLIVFALITPKVLRPTGSIHAPTLPPELLGYHQSAGSEVVATEEQKTINTLRLAISKGAHLHRVTSGGGGWGKRQGLLSLEPAMDFGSEKPDLTPVRHSEGLGDKDGDSGSFPSQRIVEVARPGDMVEFFAGFLSEEEEQAVSRKESLRTSLKAPDTRLWHSGNWSEGDVCNYVWGVIPPQHSNSATVIPTLGNKLITVPHQFGMLSENGMVLQRLENQIDKQAPAGFSTRGTHATNITRIDVPHTVWTFSTPSRVATPTSKHSVVRPGKVKVKETSANVLTFPTNFEEDVLTKQQTLAGPRKHEDSSHGNRARSKGGHKAALVGRSAQPDGRRAFRARNSEVRIVKYMAPILIRKHKVA